MDYIEKLWRMGEAEAVSWRRSYVRTVPVVLARLRTRSNRWVVVLYSMLF